MRRLSKITPLEHSGSTMVLGYKPGWSQYDGANAAAIHRGKLVYYFDYETYVYNKDTYIDPVNIFYLDGQVTKLGSIVKPVKIDRSIGMLKMAPIRFFKVTHGLFQGKHIVIRPYTGYKFRDERGQLRYYYDESNILLVIDADGIKLQPGNVMVTPITDSTDQFQKGITDDGVTVYYSKPVATLTLMSRGKVHIVADAEVWGYAQ